MFTPTLPYPIRRAVILAYIGTSLALSIALFIFSAQRSSLHLVIWTAACLIMVAVTVFLPRQSILIAGAGAFLLGFARTVRGDAGMDLGVVLIAIAVAGHLWRSMRGKRSLDTDFAGLLLLALALVSLISLGFFIYKVLSFTPAPGFSYQSYAFNPQGLPAKTLFPRVVDCALIVFTWFGLYQYARSAPLNGRLAGNILAAVLVINVAVLGAQQFLDPHLLQPAGAAIDGRLNGLTSYCYALGAGLIGIILLFPLWRRTGRAGVIFNLLMAALIMVSVTASGSRNALLALLVASLGWMVVEGARAWRTDDRRRALVLAALLLIVLVAIGSLYALTPPGPASPIARLKLGIETDGLFGHIQRTRLFSYPLHFAVMGAYPLAGTGIGAYYAEVVKQYHLLTPDLAVTDAYLMGSYAPNMFLNIGVELGVPAMAALCLVFLLAGYASFRARARATAPMALVALLTLILAMQFGPELYNAEALVFFWLMIGFAARGGVTEAVAAGEAVPVRTRQARLTAAILWGGAALAIFGHLLAAPALSVENQWQRLRWHLDVGFYPAEAGGRWSEPEAMFVTDSQASEITLQWHAGDPAAPEYETPVSFYVEGRLVETSLAAAGQQRISVLPLPTDPGFKRISVKVGHAFVPDAELHNGDRRELGIFLDNQ
jgi:O-antigen ligase